FSGKSRGFGFVEMSTEAEAEAAVKGLDGKDLMGRPLAVSVARPMKAE
ncbi:MAG: RNA-binding protein, partial [Patescibacteria group bacterium]